MSRTSQSASARERIAQAFTKVEDVLDQLLPILMIIEILYTVRSRSGSTCWCPSRSCWWP